MRPDLIALLAANAAIIALVIWAAFPRSRHRYRAKEPDQPDLRFYDCSQWPADVRQGYASKRRVLAVCAGVDEAKIEDVSVGSGRGHVPLWSADPDNGAIRRLAERLAKAEATEPELCGSITSAKVADETIHDGPAPRGGETAFEARVRNYRMLERARFADFGGLYDWLYAEGPNWLMDQAAKRNDAKMGKTLEDRVSANRLAGQPPEFRPPRRFESTSEQRWDEVLNRFITDQKI
jgi:hypothetical protein